ncbi:hypothetical protein L208DRAFT_1408654, partial [Tricholoma matsutake]
MMLPKYSEKPATNRPSKEYFCDCSRFCKGRQNKVSRSTHLRHAPSRNADLKKRLACFRRSNNSTAIQMTRTSWEGDSRPSNGASLPQESLLNTANAATPATSIPEALDTDFDCGAVVGMPV